MSKNNVSGPTAGTCGGYRWVIQWLLDKPSPKGGYIVQRINTVMFATDDAGKSIDPKAHTGGRIDPSIYPYWEAWRVDAGSAQTDFADTGDVEDDTYSSGGFGPKTKGWRDMFGTAYFYEDTPLPKVFKVDPDSPAGILPSTRVDPKMGAGSGLVIHNLYAKWDCVSGVDDATKIETL